jgi:hypothetical protein
MNGASPIQSQVLVNALLSTNGVAPGWSANRKLPPRKRPGGSTSTALLKQCLWSLTLGNALSCNAVAIFRG